MSGTWNVVQRRVDLLKLDFLMGGRGRVRNLRALHYTPHPLSAGKPNLSGGGGVLKFSQRTDGGRGFGLDLADKLLACRGFIKELTPPRAAGVLSRIERQCESVCVQR